MFSVTHDVDYSKYKALKLHLRDGVMTVTLSNPGKRNAVNAQTSEELCQIWDDLHVDPNVEVVILTGEGDSFCSGADVAALADAADAEPRKSLTNPSSRLARKQLMSMLDCEKPIIAKVRGVAYGLGLTLALACDMVFASKGTRLCDSHVKVGLVAGDGAVLLWPLAVGIHRAKEYLMTGEPLSAEVAEQIGLINRALPDEQLDAHVLTLAEKLKALPPHAVNYTKHALNQVLKQVGQPAFETSLGYEIYSMGMHDVAEATHAMVEKRKGKYTGT
jgi:enoyl-CoA hydratase